MFNKLTLITAMILSVVLLTNCVRDKYETKSSDYNYSKDNFINDDEIMNLFEKDVVDHYTMSGNTQIDQYESNLIERKSKINLKSPNTNELYGHSLYDQTKNGILIFGIVFKCDKCPNYHLQCASAFAISADGICVTNYHVFKALENEKLKYETAYVRDYNGNTYPVTEVIAGIKNDDIAIFKIDTKGKEISCLPIGKTLSPGSDVHVISHPSYRFYSYSTGNIARSYIYRSTNNKRQAITADFAGGSSGAPVLDSKGNVVGIVAGTQNIYYNSNDYQMTIKDIIPVSQLKALIE
jgi:hypothetical protein